MAFKLKSMSYLNMSIVAFSLKLLVVVARHAQDSNEKNVWVQNNDHLVTILPGQPDVDFRHYAGHVTVNEKSGRALFYWFYEAWTLPDEKPLVLWLNGGN